MIPPLIHLWWDANPAPDWIRAATASWQDTNPNLRVRLWSNEPPVALARRTAQRNQSSVIEHDSIRHHANQVRWHLLRDYGGVWVDCDTTPLHPLDDLLDDPTPFCGAVVLPEATVIGGPPGHQLWADLIHESARPQPETTAPKVSGSHALARVLLTHQKVRVLEPGAFFSHDTSGNPILPPTNGPRYCTHAWATSTQRRSARRGAP